MKNSTKRVLLVTAATFAVVDAYVPSANQVSSSSFVSRKSRNSRSSPAMLRMDTETNLSVDLSTRVSLEKLLHRELPSLLDLTSSLRENVSDAPTLEEAEAAMGMPWRESIDRWLPSEGMLYMKFWEWQMSFMKENLTNLKVLPCINHSGSTDFSYNENSKKKARIVNLCASCDEYRKIRMTYYDAGENTQVFNAVFYPDPKYDLPVLGIDLLAFNRKKYLAIVDFQPLHDDEAKHDAKFEHLLAPIKEQYDTLKGRMSSKFYDETQFFSNQMLFARFDDESVVDKELYPAFQSYMKTHLDLIRNTSGDDSPNRQAAVMARQKAYDTYSAERDPAMGLFMAMFGADWAQDFVHEFLFDMSESKGCPPARPMGAPPAAAGAAGGNPYANAAPSSGGNPYANQARP
jgi:15,16-dihydrobiliverdin:ferredoxin oxidoreductase